jgi:hypothetical protein
VAVTPSNKNILIYDTGLQWNNRQLQFEDIGNSVVSNAPNVKDVIIFD